MGKLYQGTNWLIRVQGNEHSPIHVHVLCPQGRASISLDGQVVNSGVPVVILRKALAWVAAHPELIAAEWARMNNPSKR